MTRSLLPPRSVQRAFLCFLRVLAWQADLPQNPRNNVIKAEGLESVNTFRSGISPKRTETPSSPNVPPRFIEETDRFMLRRKFGLVNPNPATNRHCLTPTKPSIPDRFMFRREFGHPSTALEICHQKPHTTSSRTTSTNQQAHKTS
ncbi:uncharacterized protein LOC134218361 [Armigeres subalbatus]|uniref:uncharacterized protein LOC134218361 n=1 Tax=Armigeres subalbatus TaxID=124917 RepID=UPI002ED21B5A